MAILVTGATGTVGRQVVEQLAKRGADVRAPVRDPARANFPAGVAVAQGDLGRRLRSYRDFAAEIATSVQRPSEPQHARQGTSS